MPTIQYKNSKGERLSGVTTIISGNVGWNKQQLMYWAWKEGTEGRNYKDTSSRAADAGTIAHYLIECDIKGKDPDVSQYEQELVDKAETAYLNYLQWKQNVNFEVFEAEPHLVSEMWQYGATPDLIASINDKPSIFDWKSGNGVYEDYLMQLAAYKMAWEEVTGIPLTGGYHLLRISKEDAHFTHHYWDNLDRAWEAFIHALALHNMHKELKKLSK